MNPRLKSALLWGVVGGLAFLVLVQGYAVAREPLVSITEGVAIAALVGGVTTSVVYALEYRIAEWAASRASDQ